MEGNAPNVEAPLRMHLFQMSVYTGTLQYSHRIVRVYCSLRRSDMSEIGGKRKLLALARNDVRDPERTPAAVNYRSAEGSLDHLDCFNWN